MCKYSVVVPVYQAEAYLEECIESVLGQQEQDWELILVDDGSTDQSPRICDRYAERYPEKIRVLHKKNGGPISARCSGYQAARGNYIMNLDADDLLAGHALQTIDRSLRQEAVDILIFSYQRIDRSGTVRSQNCHLPDETYPPGRKTELFETLWREHGLNLVWNKVFRADLIRDSLRIPENLKQVADGDDIVIVTPLLLQAQTIRTIGDVLYQYRMVSNSISKSFRFQKETDFILSRSYLQEQLQKAGLWNEKIQACFYRTAGQTISYIIWQCARSHSTFEQKKAFFARIMGLEFYQNSLPYIRTLPFPNRKKLSLWLFQHRQFRLFVWYEQMQEWLKNGRKSSASSCALL